MFKNFYGNNSRFAGTFRNVPVGGAWIGPIRQVHRVFREGARNETKQKTNVNIQLDYWQTIGLFPRSSPKNQHNFPFDHTMVLFGLKNRMQS